MNYSFKEYLKEEGQKYILRKEITQSNTDFLKEFNNKPEEEKEKFLSQKLKEVNAMGKKKYDAFNNFLRKNIDKNTILRAKSLLQKEIGGKDVAGMTIFLDEYNNKKTDEEKLQHTIETFKKIRERNLTEYKTFAGHTRGRIDNKIRLMAMSEIAKLFESADRSGINMFFKEYNSKKTDEEKLEYVIKYFRERLKTKPKNYKQFVSRLKGKIDESIRLRAMDVITKERYSEGNDLGLGAEIDILDLATKKQTGIRTNVGIRLKDEEEKKEKSAKVINYEDKKVAENRIQGLKKAVLEKDEKKILYEFIRLIKNTNYLKNDVLFKRETNPNKNVFVEVKNVRYSGEKTEKALEGEPQTFDSIPFSYFIDMKEDEERILKDVVNKNKESLNKKLDTVIKNQLINSEKYGSRIMLAIHDIKADKDNIFWVNLRKKINDIEFFFTVDKRGIKTYLKVKNLGKEDLLPRKTIKNSLKEEELNLITLLVEEFMKELK